MDRYTGALAQDDSGDYTLKAGEGSAWITVGNISVYIKRTDEGVVVDLFPRFYEDIDSLASCWAHDAEAVNAQEQGREKRRRAEKDG